MVIATAVIVLIIVPLYILTIPTARLAAAPFEITIEDGDSLSKISAGLKEQKLIRSQTLFVVYTFTVGDHKNLKAGGYMIPENSSLIDIEQILAGGFANSNDIIVTIPEGINIWEIDRRLVTAGLIKEGDFARKYWKEEGSFFPDTYRFFRHKPVTLQDIASKIKKRQGEELKKLDFPLDSRRAQQIMVIASMIEKEARQKRDMQIVSDIIQKRIKIGMALKLDATVAYGYCLRKSLAIDFFKDCLVHLAPIRSEINIDSEYNTYRRLGLPPAPISNPGADAIDAALHPVDTPYLYYLSVPDGSRIIYSKTGAEHEANRKKYLGL